jgi:exodeoxyribonuclease V alpha subunit
VPFFFPEADPDGPGTAIGRLASGETVRGRVGARGDLDEGRTYRFWGRWDKHERHGWQFAFTAFAPDAPHDRGAVVEYLTRFAAHVGPRTAAKLWDAYGDQAVAVLARQPERVADDGLMTPAQAGEAAADLRPLEDERETIIDLVGLFSGKGFPHALPRDCFKKWGVQAPALIRKNPFILLTEHMPGCGFSRCDTLYLSLGLPPEGPERQMLAAWYCLDADSDGHTWLPAKVVANEVRRHIGDDARPGDAMKLGLDTGLLARRKDDGGTVWIAEARRARNEATVASRLRALRAAPAGGWAAVPQEALSEHQYAAALRLLDGPVGILTGPPGVGKTHTTAVIAKAQVAHYGDWAVRVAAPTGKAATRITAALHRLGLEVEATTIHRLLEAVPGGRGGFRFQRDESNPLDCRVLVVDEASMLDADLAARLFSACRPGTNVLLVGDRYQLPPVGHGAVLRDLIDAGLPHAELTEIRRNAGAIVHACNAIKDGRPFETFKAFNAARGRNLVLVEAGAATDPTEAAADRVEAVQRVMTKLRAFEWLNPLVDVQVLCARNDTRHHLNTVLQSFLNPSTSGAGGRFRRGDKVICLRNRFFFSPWDRHQLIFCANGDTGLIEDIVGRTMHVRLDPDRLVQVPLGTLRGPAGGGAGGDEEGKDTGCDFDLAYCCTAHKFQGSECPVVVVVVEPRGWMVATREWHYTAISRAQTLCILVGQTKVIEHQCRRVSLRDRKTALVELIHEGVSP